MDRNPPERAAPGAGGLTPGHGSAAGPGAFRVEGSGPTGTGTVGTTEQGSDGGGGAGGTPAQQPKGGPPHRSVRRWLFEWAVIIAVALLVAFVVRTFVAQTFYIPSTSMYPTLKAGDRIVVNKLYSTIHPGDIIVFRTPAAEDCGGPPVPDLVKRVVGLPGQTISAHGGQVYITGKLLPEPWLPDVKTTYTSNFGPDKIPAGDYFVMGDNRVNSCDSRMWGPVKSSLIVGKVVFIIWPPGRLRFF